MRQEARIAQGGPCGLILFNCPRNSDSGTELTSHLLILLVAAFTLYLSCADMVGHAEKGAEHTLEFLLAFNGRIHRYAGGYWLKFEITKAAENKERPHGPSYSFTLHGPDNRRLVGFDNASSVPGKRARFKKRRQRRRTIGTGQRRTRGVLTNSKTRALKDRGIPFETVEVDEGDAS